MNEIHKRVDHPYDNFSVLMSEVFEFLLAQQGSPRGISDDNVKPTSAENAGKFCLPVEYVYPVLFFVVKKAGLVLEIEVASNEGIPAFDIVS